MAAVTSEPADGCSFKEEQREALEAFLHSDGLRRERVLAEHREASQLDAAHKSTPSFLFFS